MDFDFTNSVIQNLVIELVRRGYFNFRLISKLNENNNVSHWGKLATVNYEKIAFWS